MILVAGHACVDLIPQLHSALPSAGGLATAGALTLGGGGSVSNVGIALHKLGVAPVRLVARVGDDLLGRELRGFYARAGQGLADHLVTVAGGATGYSVVLQPPGEDRRLLHFPGVNDDFAPDDLTPDHFDGCRHLHFGYPMLMRSLYADGGHAMAAILKKAQDAGLSTSVDLARPDPAGDAARADWLSIFRVFLPYVDLFVPSVPEIRLALKEPGMGDLKYLAERLLRLGCGGVVLKDGPRGLYCRTKKDTSSWAPRGWNNLDLRQPCFRVGVVNTVGSGDATIAGLLSGLYQGLPPGEVLEMACGVGACCCEKMDSVGGVRSWAETKARVSAGWPVLGAE